MRGISSGSTIRERQQQACAATAGGRDLQATIKQVRAITLPQEPGARPSRLVVADDHRLFREGVASLLDCATDIELIG